MKKHLLGLAVVCAAFIGMSSSASAATLLVDDFDRGEKPNALGGDFGAWDKDPNDATQTCALSFDKGHAFGGVGYSLKLDYDVDSPNPAYNGLWSKLEGADLRSYKKLTFYVKGDKDTGYTKSFKLELKNGKEVGQYVLKGVTDQWKRVSIPLSEFGLKDLRGMTEFVIVFDDASSDPKSGSVFLDEIAFES